MAANQTQNHPAEIQKIFRRFVRWRSSHTGRLPIPEPLWAEAAQLARERGINQIAKALHLEYGKLKEKTLALGQGKGVEDSRTARPHLKRSQPRPPEFVELFAPPNPGSCLECRVELEGRRGKMRIEFKGIATAELVALGRGGRPQGYRLAGTVVPGEAPGGPFFRLPVCFSEPAGHDRSHSGVRRPGILAGAEAIVERAFSLVADGL